MKSYRNHKTKEISFPLGGIGAGCIGLAGNGRLKDWEVYNHPYKNTSNGFTHIMVRAEKKGEVLDARVLQGDWIDGATGGETRNVARGNGGFGYGMGPYRGTMAGVPHFKEWEFKGEYPFAEMEFRDASFPGGVKLSAFSTFIPLNDKDSSLPAAHFEVEFENPTSDRLDYTAFFTLNNPLPYGTGKNSFVKEGSMSGIQLECEKVDTKDLVWGNLCIATDHEDISYQEYWYRAEWFDSLEMYWHDVMKGGHLKNRFYPSIRGNDRTPYVLDGEEHATLAAHCELEAGEKKKIRFILTWYFPNCANTWHPEPKAEAPVIWQNYYTKLTGSAKDCAVYGISNWDRLYRDTKLFKDTLYQTSLPDFCLEAVSANMSILKTATCLRLENGEFYGFEGSGLTEGICEGSCTHVWNYAYALPYLFPKLERSMRDVDFAYNQREDGGMSFRLMLPLGRERDGFRPCVDGQMGGVMKAWRDYLLCGDKEWLSKNWIPIKKSIEFAWAETNLDRWDENQDGILEGRQHHTMDMELFGPSSWLNGFYLGALKAGANIAEVLGYEEEKVLYLRLFENGKKFCNKILFNGEYFQQDVDLKDMTLLKKYDKMLSIDGYTAIDAYWNKETEEIKYQVANGCATDQVLAQWHANLCGLGEIFEEEKTKSALRSIYKYNRVLDARNTFNAGRIYALDDDRYLKICGWPDGAPKPSVPLTYADEVFCGLEYQAAAHMIQEGLLEEGFEIVKDIRDRFDGEQRNPWNEFECGSNYARSMASFSLVPAVSGYEVDMGQQRIAFYPKLEQERFASFFSMDSGWGLFELSAEGTKLEVEYGLVTIQRFGLPEQYEDICGISCGGENLQFSVEKGVKGVEILLEEPVTIHKEETLEVWFDR